MKRLIALPVILSCCLSFGFAQGIRGTVKLTGKATIVATGHSVVLSWNASQGAMTYSVYRGATHDGPYVKIAAGILTTNYIDIQVTHNRTLYYVTTAVNGNTESSYSNETVAVIP